MSFLRCAAAKIGPAGAVVAEERERRGGVRGGRVRAKAGMGSIVPSLHLDDGDEGEDGTSAVGGGGDDGSHHAAPSASVLGENDRRGAGGSGSVASDRARRPRGGGGSGGGGEKKAPAEGAGAAPGSGIEALVCRRCRGTVEGPLNSSCTCTVRGVGVSVCSVVCAFGSISYRPFLLLSVNQLLLRLRAALEDSGANQ